MSGRRSRSRSSRSTARALLRLPALAAVVLAGVVVARRQCDCVPRDGPETVDAAFPDGSSATDPGVSAWLAARDPARVRIATYNVERLFDSACDSGQCGASDYEAAPAPGVVDARVSRIADGILRLDADIVLLQEIETAELLQDIADALGGRYGVVHLGETGRTASLDVGVLAVGSLLRTISHADERLVRPDGTETSFARDLAEVHVSRFGREIVVFAAHFKSKADDDPGRRLAEAQRAGEIIESLARSSPGALVVFGGDLNDVPGSDPLNALERSGALIRTTAALPDGSFDTFDYRGDWQALDHLFLARDGAGELDPTSVAPVYEGGGDRRAGLAGSDHAALVSTFLMTP